MECLGRSSAANSQPKLDLLSFGWQNGPRNRRPITALAAQGFWGIKEALNPNSPPSSVNADGSNSRFYIGRGRGGGDETDGMEGEGGAHFFDDITTLYRRQTMLFQKSCQQLTDIYKVERATSNGAAASAASTTVAAAPPMSSSAVAAAAAAASKAASILSPFGECDNRDVDHLYGECIYTVLHMIGCDANRAGQFKMLEHLRKAFRLDPKRHLNLYETASSRPKPAVKLNVVVLEARDLSSVSRDSSVFCTFYLRTSSSSSSDPSSSFSTACKARTRNPAWDESFSVPLSTSSAEDDCSSSSSAGEILLHLDVWSMPSDEKLPARLKRIHQVRDGRGLKDLIVGAVKQSASASATSTTTASHKLIGSVEIPVWGIPACGFKKWWTLGKCTSEKESAFCSCFTSFIFFK